MSFFLFLAVAFRKSHHYINLNIRDIIEKLICDIRQVIGIFYILNHNIGSNWSLPISCSWSLLNKYRHNEQMQGTNFRESSSILNSIMVPCLLGCENLLRGKYNNKLNYQYVCLKKNWSPYLVNKPFCKSGGVQLFNFNKIKKSLTELSHNTSLKNNFYC